jgi:hypothetical protein
MGQRGGTLLPVCRQDSPKMALAHRQDLGRLIYRHLMFQYAVQHLQSRLFFPGQNQSSHGLTFSLTS